MSDRVIVVGAGAVGAATAYELARSGRKVVLLDRDLTARNDGASPMPRPRAASWAAAGILPPAKLATATDPLDQLRGLSHARFPSLVGELAELTGLDCGLTRCGGWYLADTVGETASMAGMMQYWQEMEIECEEKSLDEVRQAEPALDTWCERVRGRAWWVPDEYQIHSPLYVNALRLSVAQLGAEVRYGSWVLHLEENASAVHIELSNGETLSADQIVISAGAWTGLVSDRLRLAASLVPVRGQILRMRCESLQLGGIVNLGHRYLVPRAGGEVLIGSCEEEVGFQHGTTPSGLDDLRQFVREVCPEIASGREMDAWSGLRPMTFDGFPMCGKLPESDRVFVAAGHFRSGVHLSAGTARLLCDLVNGNEPPIGVDAFRVGKQQSLSSDA